MMQGVKQGWHDGVAILFTVFLLVAFPSVGNYLHERKLVRKHLLDRSRLMVNVERSNREPTSVNISCVVVGDIVHLKEGDRVPADGLFIDHDEDLMLDEVIKGHGRMVVTCIGANTVFAEMHSLGTHHNPNEKTLCFATAVIGIQHGMPFAITVALCQWKEKVVQNQAKPQNLSACVTMGLITVICIETTGELMCSQGEVKEFWMGGKDLCSDEVDSEADQVVLETLHQGISATQSPTKICSFLG
ncbi:putative calcium-transporting ATPase 13 plasma membrane-type isoform X2 [Prunus yedoensis var. nudiflora]|uniref:Putative calcium-transporting ATPase 13 plasma membrane-type isoform X2 n=1 Tax=Prunus yedoensis var. nudiflora TaxID=2094558 RepID=A0A314UWF5_PRUYE|nr:putative calcium-transporting ATPase 13 plasma membrane-type isoform X2 [Prunus yedoensis var. nudiflora]